MRGSTIVVSADPKGKFVEGTIAATWTTAKPGMIAQADPTVALKGGRQTWKPFTRGANGARPAGPLIVLRENSLVGATTATGYNAGDRAFGYIPEMGDELNVLLKDIAGTADVHNAGELLIVEDTTGKLIVTTGSPASQPFQLNETILAPTQDTLAWVTTGAI